MSGSTCRASEMNWIGLVGQVGRQVVALFRRRGRLDLVVVVDQVGIPLARVAAEESVEPLEASPERPAVVRPGGRLLTGRDQVPLAHHVGVVTVREQDLREIAVLERHVPVVARIAGRELGDARHRVAVMIAPGNDARPTRRTQRSRVHVVVPQTIARERVEIRRLDRTAEATELTKTRVVQHDEQHVRRTLRRAGRSRPRRTRFVGSATDHTRKDGSRLVLNNRHLKPQFDRAPLTVGRSYSGPS